MSVPADRNKPVPRLVVPPVPQAGDSLDTRAPDLRWAGQVIERTVLAALQVNTTLLKEAGAAAHRLATRRRRQSTRTPGGHLRTAQQGDA